MLSWLTSSNILKTANTNYESLLKTRSITHLSTFKHLVSRNHLELSLWCASISSSRLPTSWRYSPSVKLKKCQDGIRWDGLHCSHGFYWTQVNLGSDLWVRMSVRHWCLVPPDDQTNPNCATWWPNIQLINIQLINTSGAIWWSIVQLMQVVPSGGQICNWCKWCHLVAKFSRNASNVICWSNLELMQVRCASGNVFY